MDRLFMKKKMEIFYSLFNVYSKIVLTIILLEIFS